MRSTYNPDILQCIVTTLNDAGMTWEAKHIAAAQRRIKQLERSERSLRKLMARGLKPGEIKDTLGSFLPKK